MVKLHAIENSEQFFQLQQKGVRVVDYASGVVVGAKGYHISRLRRRRLQRQSKFPDAADAWRNMTESEKETWRIVGRETGRTGWQAFLQNVVWVAQFGPTDLGAGEFGVQNFGGVSEAVPATAASMVTLRRTGRLGLVNYGLVKYGGTKIDNDTEEIVWNSGPATRFLVDSTNRTTIWSQHHPKNYTIRKLRTGGGKIYDNFEINENLTLPLNFGLSYASYIEPAGVAPSIKVVIILQYDDNGTIKEQPHEIPIDISPNWSRLTLDIDSAPTPLVGYRIDIVFTDVLTMILFDRLKLRHSGANWAIDPECEDMELDIAELFKDVLKPWNSPDDGIWTFSFSSMPDDVPLIME